MRLVRPAHPGFDQTRCWILAAAAAVTLIGCGQNENADKEGAVKSAASAPASAAGEPKRMEKIELPPPLVPPIEGPVEYEEAVDKPLVTKFPAPASAEAARPAVENLPADDELMGRPLVIAGKVVPFDEIKREICLGSAPGVSEVEHITLRIFIEQELKRREEAEAGSPGAKVDFGEEEMQAYVKSLEDELKVEYPEGGVGLQDVLNGFGSTHPMDVLRVQKLFEKVFLPENPADFPKATVDAIMGQPGGESILDEYRQRFERRQANPDAPKDSEDRFFDSIIVGQIAQHLHDVAKIEPGAVSGVLYRVNGVDIQIDEIWKAILPMLTIMEVRTAKQWLTNSRLLREALVKAGDWLSDEEAAEAYHVHSDPYKDSIFSLERIALTQKMFPTVERYKEYRHIYESFKRMKAPEMTEAALSKQAEHRTNKLVGQVTADVDVILCAALDFRANRWKENGWLDAENRMKDVIKLLVEAQRPWEELVEKYSDFFAYPVALSARGQDDAQKEPKGHFRGVQHNALSAELGESVYRRFLSGTSITDFIFFEQEVGTLGDPMRGPMGWYLPRLIKRSKPPARLSVDPATMKTLVSDDYLDCNLNKYAQELIAQNDVYGLDLPNHQPTPK